jgi:hypothetical protein
MRRPLPDTQSSVPVVPVVLPTPHDFAQETGLGELRDCGRGTCVPGWLTMRLEPKPVSEP